MHALYVLQLAAGVAAHQPPHVLPFAPQVNILAADTLPTKNLHRMSTQSNLEQAASGLLMMSESDYPFDYFTNDATAITEPLVLEITGKPQGTLVEQVTLEHFFRNMANPNSPSLKPETTARFREFMETLKNELTDITVYRVGEIQVQVLIIGINLQGTVSGMRTLLIET